MSSRNRAREHYGNQYDEAGLPRDDAYLAAVKQDPIDSNSTVEEGIISSNPLNERVAVLENQLKDMTSKVVTIESLPAKLWKHVGVVFLIGIGAVGAFWGIQATMYSSMKDSLVPLITDNGKLSSSNQTNITNLQSQYSSIDNSLDSLKDAINSLSTQIAVLNSKTDAE